MIDIEKMKQAALAATQGEWKTMRRGDEDCLDVDVFKSGGWNGYVTLAMGIGNENAIHIATANPSAVLELITRLEAAEAASKFWESHANDLATQDNKLIAEMTQQAIEAEAAITGLLGKLEAAEQDAARYKTLQDMSGLCFNYAAEYQIIGQLNHYVDSIKPQVDKALQP